MNKTKARSRLFDENSDAIKKRSVSSKKLIRGVKLVKLKDHHAEDGSLVEIGRLNSGRLPECNNFQIRQITYSETIVENVKAWHYHYYQNDLWFLPKNQPILVGLLDLRKESKVQLVVNQLYLGKDISHLLFIPRGVAHGYKSLSKVPLKVFYFTDKTYNPNNPDEHELDWQILGVKFWQL